jgi:DNA-binding transcriptional ArsR family regulator
MRLIQAILLAQGFPEEQVLLPREGIDVSVELPGPVTTRSHRLRQSLLIAPSTVEELACLLDMDTREVHVGLSILRGQGHVETMAGLVLTESGKRKLYRLTSNGTALAKRERPSISVRGRVA